MKVTYIIDSLRRHGAQRFLVHLTRGLAALGYEQRIINLSGVADPDIEQNLEASCREITRIGKRSLLLGGAGWLRLVRNLKRSRPEVVMTLLPMADTLGRSAARLAGCGVLLTSIRARDLAKPAWQRHWDRRTIHWARKVIFNSRHVVEFACREEGIREEQVVVIPNGVEDLRARSLALRTVSRREFALETDTVLLGAVGRLQRQKNIPLLLRACAALSTGRNWKLLVVGDGAEKFRLVSLAQELGIAGRVLWAGERIDVEACLAAMDIFIHTADYEGMPNAVMEAMAMGLPVIASSVDGARELIRDGTSGYLVPPGDVSAFAKRIDQMMDEPDLARLIGDQAHRDILEGFGVPRMIAAYHELFVSLVTPETC